MNGRRTGAKVVLKLLLKTVISWMFIAFVIISIYNDNKKKIESTSGTLSFTNRNPLKYGRGKTEIAKTTTRQKVNLNRELISDDAEIRIICSASFESKDIYKKIHADQDSSLPQKLAQIFVITPTYKRPEMIPELIRLGQSLVLVPRLHWIIAEDGYSCSDTIIDHLNNLGLPHTYLLSPMPKRYNSLKKKPKGVSNRRAGLEWIKEHGNDEDVLYFLDDDNTVSVKLFDEIRFTKKVSMFPVGLIGRYRVSSPIVKKGKVIGFYDSWIGSRKFAVDMAGFAVNVGFLRKSKKAEMPYKAGYEENGFLKSLRLSLDDIEPKAEDCTKILVWHTKTVKKKFGSSDATEHKDHNIIKLTENMMKMSVIE